MKQSLGHRVCDTIAGFLVEHSMVLILLIFFMVLIADLYGRFWRVIKTDHVDVMHQYIDLQMRKRYGANKKV